jgi:hypothetical protein
MILITLIISDLIIINLIILLLYLLINLKHKPNRYYEYLQDKDP